MRPTKLPFQHASRWQDIFYSSDRHRQKTLDIMAPTVSAKANNVTCIYIHGGSWQCGDKQSVVSSGILRAMCQRGYTSASLNYRLSPEVVHPMHALDIAQGIKWVHNNISHYGGDPDKLVVMGHSAGAHLALYSVAEATVFREMDLQSSSIRALIGISGVYNIARMANVTFYGSLVIPPAFGNRADTWRLASLLSVLAKYGDICPLVQIPTLLINAKDDFHLQKDSEELLQWIRKYGTSHCRSEVIDQCNHFSILHQQEEKAISSAAIDKVASFLDNF
uniref:Carbohydrate esterase putative n=1 Tax=Albugo laibachii Nc14 TaxID=890382 RepID=F0WT81_9STRA|nr:carbohydrate esterase putative [Albugo laibachii Nc14]|eukprot:CCA24569.1 carbohydrate esterase putative [Albugo laibachii Nc14]